MTFRFLNGWGKNQKDEYFMAHANDMKFKFQYLPIKFHRNTNTPIHLCTGFGCCCPTKAGLGSYNRHCVAQRLKYSLAGPL